jgi:hypothetical protein
MKLQSRVPELFPYSIFQTNVAYMEIYHDKYTEIRFRRAYIFDSKEKNGRTEAIKESSVFQLVIVTSFVAFSGECEEKLNRLSNVVG